MTNHNINKLIRAFGVIIFVIIALILLIFAFSDSKEVSAWSKIGQILKITHNYDSDADFIRIIDVGQGDSILISSNGYNSLVDVGPLSSYADLRENLQTSNVSDIDAVMISHYHSDHIGALVDLAEQFSIRNLILPDPKLCEATDESKVVANVVKDENGNVYTAKQGMHMDVGDFEVTILGCFFDLKNENNRSSFAMVSKGEKRFLLTGDAESEAEKRLLKENIDLDCDVLKLGHHGSSGSTSNAFLQACSPEIAAISCGKGNQYSHPHTETLRKMEKAGIPIYRTDLSGDITFYVSDDNEITVETEY